ncbi:hypothetical protein BU25DRAFT_410912 [Macroventuria anomochaeta]|uniref:Uncharacterized protein n=1 Tax=Macroventuria anomochaeta TaxID=301207 RepID=A0ACB6RZ37_9PLEO|nr:uncharacterized protein BU25DRAFT_410912 [Macroventuria anomochaeta]KAF2627290.1 hypothetical protein BU25DRAFT_410912 [Macroventuria anomochaeta]
MRSFRYTLLALPLLGGVIAEEPLTQTSDASNFIYANAQEAFQDLLNALPEESLQAALNSLTKFKAGVFESHRRGVEHVHNSSPALATKLIVAAVQDLKKRQVAAPSNGTTPVVSSSQTPDQPESSAQQSVQQQSSQGPESTQQQSSAEAPATTAPSTPTSRPVLIPVEVTTTNNRGSTVIQTSEVLSEVTASVQVTVTRTTTNNAGSTVVVTTQEVRPAVIRTTTDSRGSSVAVTSAANYAPTRGEVLTTTNAEGSTFLTTYTPGGGRVSSVRLVTTTDAQGRPQTLTSITYVDPTAVGGSDEGGSGASPTATGRPSVQSGSANKHNAVMGLVGLGAFAFFF